MRLDAKIKCIFTLLAALLVQPNAEVLAQTPSVATFFKGKQITLFIASAVGGGYDAYARLVARHLGNYIPGNPTIVPVNMPGAGGEVVVIHLLNAAPRDGTAIGALQPGSMTAPLYTEKKPYDSRSLIYLGSANSEVDGCWVRTDASVKSYGELKDKELVIGASSPGGVTYDLPTVENFLFGIHYKIISGYAGDNQVLLAMDRNEVQGICGTGVPAMMAQRAAWVKSGFVKMLVQENFDGGAALNAQGVPRSTYFAKTDEDRDVLKLVTAPQEFGRPFAMPPGIPADRVEALRLAFVQALQDKQLLAEAKTMNLDIKALSGEELQNVVKGIYATPSATVERAKQALGTAPR